MLVDSGYLMLSFVDVEVLELIQAIVSVLDSLKTDLNTSLHQVFVTLAGIQQQAVNNTQARSIVDMLQSSTAGVALPMAVEQLQSARNTSLRVRFIANGMLRIADDVGRSMLALDELNTTSEEVGTMIVRVTETVLVSVT